MKQQQVYNLKEFAARHHLESIFGAYAAHIYIDDLCGSRAHPVHETRVGDQGKNQNGGTSAKY